MPTVRVNGVELYYEEAGSGTPLIFSHEFSGSYRSWDGQLSFFARRYRAIAYNCRGYPPSSVPADQSDYSEENLVADLLSLMDALGIERANIAGLSMGGAVTLKFAMAHPDRCISAVVAGCGSGSVNPQQFKQDQATTAQALEEGGLAARLETMRQGPSRWQLFRKDPLNWGLFAEQFMRMSPQGLARTARGVQGRRRTVYEVGDELQNIRVPVLLIVGDEDEACLEPGLFMKRRIPNAGLCVFPKTGHLVNLEEPELFNRSVLDFLTAVEQDRWPSRQPAAAAT